MSELLLLAASGLTREVLVTVRASGQYDIVGILDDDPELLGVLVDGAPVLGAIDDVIRFERAFLLVCLPAGQEREALVNALRQLGVDDGRYATVVDSDVRRPDCWQVGPGSILLRNATIGPEVKLGSHVVVMPGVNLGCDAQAADFSTLSTGALLGDRARLGRAATIGKNAGVGDGLSVGDQATVGLGAAVLQDVPNYETWEGVPARCFRAGRGIGF